MEILASSTSSEAPSHSLRCEVFGNGCCLRFRLADFALLILDVMIRDDLLFDSP